MTRNKSENRRRKRTKINDDDFVVYKWEFPETEENQGMTKNFVGSFVRFVNR